MPLLFSMVPLVINKRLRRATVMAVIITRRKIRNVSNVEKVRLAISPEAKQKWEKKHGRGIKRQNHGLKFICFELPKAKTS